MKNGSTERWGGVHIFVVDDDPSVCRAIFKTLESLGATVKSFTCAVDCLNCLRSEASDLLITDVRMPGMTGPELLKEAKNVVPHLPVLLMTGDKDEALAERAMKMGAINVMEKPLSREAILWNLTLVFGK